MSFEYPAKMILANKCLFRYLINADFIREVVMHKFSGNFNNISFARPIFTRAVFICGRCMDFRWRLAGDAAEVDSTF